MLEGIVEEAPDLVEAHVQLATAYNRLKRKEDAQREQAIVDRLNAEIAGEAEGQRRLTMHATLSCVLVLWLPASAWSAASPARAVDAQQTARPKPPRRKPKPAATSAEFDRLIEAATEARQAERWDEAIGLYAKARQAEARLRRRLLVPGHGVLHARGFHECRESFRRVVALAPKNGAGVRLPRPVRVRAEGLRPRAAAPAAVADPRRRRRQGSRQRRPVPRRDPDDADRAVRAGARNARRVRQRR